MSVRANRHAPAKPAPRSQNTIRTGLTSDAMAEALTDNLRFLLAKAPRVATRHDWYMALAYTVRDRLLHRCVTTAETATETNADPALREAVDAIADGSFSGGDRDMFRPLVDALMTRDDYMLFADYQAYIDCQQRVDDAYANRFGWTRMSILNTARVGAFSSDRSIREYCRDVWAVTPL